MFDCLDKYKISVFYINWILVANSKTCFWVMVWYPKAKVMPSKMLLQPHKLENQNCKSLVREKNHVWPSATCDFFITCYLQFWFSNLWGSSNIIFFRNKTSNAGYLSSRLNINNLLKKWKDFFHGQKIVI